MSKKYIKFTNKADKVSRLALEKLGYSTKRDDPNTIGQFGSGIKFAPIAALRNGLDWVFLGKDNLGEYQLRYRVEKEDGIDCIVYDYGDYQKSSSFTADAGILSWEDPFQIYREALANAVDAVSERSDWSVEIVGEEDLVYKEGFFSCFISASEELIRIHESFDKYFCLDRTSIFSWQRFFDKRQYELYKPVDHIARFYSHGVLISSIDNVRGVYDYNIDGIALNEERTVKSVWDLQHEVARTISNVKDETIHHRYMKAGISLNADSYYEFSKMDATIYKYHTFDESWLDSFNSLFGENSVIYDQVAEARGVHEFIKIRGYNPVLVANEHAYNMFKSFGALDYTQVTDESMMYDTDFDFSDYPQLKSAIAIAARFEPYFNQLLESNRLGLYSHDSSSIGLTVNMDKAVDERVILIDREHARSNVEDIIATLIHEFDHLSTGHRDGNADGRVFRDLADKRIGEMMVLFYEEELCSVLDGKVFLPMQAWTSKFDAGNPAKFTLEKSEMLDKVVIKIGKIFLAVNADCEFNGMSVNQRHDGNLAIAENGNGFTINNLTKVKTVRSLNV